MPVLSNRCKCMLVQTDLHATMSLGWCSIGGIIIINNYYDDSGRWCRLSRSMHVP